MDIEDLKIGDIAVKDPTQQHTARHHKDNSISKKES